MQESILLLVSEIIWAIFLILQFKFVQRIMGVFLAKMKGVGSRVFTSSDRSANNSEKREDSEEDNKERHNLNNVEKAPQRRRYGGGKRGGGTGYSSGGRENVSINGGNVTIHGDKVGIDGKHIEVAGGGASYGGSMPGVMQSMRQAGMSSILSVAGLGEAARAYDMTLSGHFSGAEIMRGGVVSAPIRSKTRGLGVEGGTDLLL